MGRGSEVTVTNEGATILKSLHIDNPTAKVHYRGYIPNRAPSSQV